MSSSGVVVTVGVEHLDLGVARRGSRCEIRMRKRSSWLSGRGYVPSCSIGFWVAMTMNGGGERVACVPSTVTWRSSIASSSADCVLGEARLISSPRTMLAKIGAGPELELAGRPVEDGDAGDVGGQQVGGELDAAEGARRCERGQRLGQAGLAHAGHVLDEQVAFGQQAEQRELDHLGLALDHALDVATIEVKASAKLGREVGVSALAGAAPSTKRTLSDREVRPRGRHWWHQDDCGLVDRRGRSLARDRELDARRGPPGEAVEGVGGTCSPLPAVPTAARPRRMAVGCGGPMRPGASWCRR